MTQRKPPVLTQEQLHSETGYLFSKKVWEMLHDILIDQRDADIKWFEDAGYRLIDPSKLTVLSDEEIKSELTWIQPEGFSWGNISKSELVKFKAITQAQLSHTRKQSGIEEK